MRALVAILVVCTWAAPLAAQTPRGVVLDFEGRRNGRVRNFVVRALLPHLELLSVDDARDKASEMGVDLQTVAGRAAVAEALEVDVFVRGEVRRSRVSLQLFGRDGEVRAEQGSQIRAGTRGQQLVSVAARGLLRVAAEQAVEPTIHTGEMNHRGVVLRFTGRGHRRARESAIFAIRHLADLIPVAEARAVSREGPPLTAPEGMLAASRRLAVDFWVTGEIFGSGRRARATLRIYDSTGEQLSSEDVDARGETVEQAVEGLFQANQDAIARARAERLNPSPPIETESEDEPAETMITPQRVATETRLRAEDRGDEEIVIDGRLDEAVWQRSERSGTFVERRPVRGGVPPVETYFSVAFDEDALYFAVTCRLAEGERPRVAELTRDSVRIFDDDAVSIKLDVRHDHRNTLGFAVNAAGAQIDYGAFDNGASFRPEFDAIWESAVTVGEDAYYVEMRIPAQALGLSESEGHRLVGLEVSRDHNARRATYDWAPIPVEFGAFSAIHYGRLEIPGTIAGGRPFTFIPYIVGGLREDNPSRFPSGTPWAAAAGFDARLRLGQDVWAEVTALTDFSQVDLDDPAVNLDRFPLFFPERRPFFLTGLDIFSFGDQGVAQPFFSRRIGIGDAGEEILMLGGAKVYGRAPLRGGRSLSVGILEALTYDDSVLSTSVGRLRVNFGDASYVGAIATLVAGQDRNADSTGGVDFLTRGERVELSGYGVGSFGRSISDTGETAPDRGGAAQLKLRWLGEVFRPTITATWIGEGFDPATGFVRRSDVMRLEGFLQTQYRTSAIGLEVVDFVTYVEQFLDSDFQRDVGRKFGGYIYPQWVNGFSIWAGIESIHEVVDEEFDIVGRTVAVGTYDGVRGFGGIERSGARNPSFALDYLGQTNFFGGTQHTMTASLGFVATRHIRFAFKGGANLIRLPGQEPLAAYTGTASLTIAPTTRLQFDSVFQLNTATETTRALFRVRWRYVPGSDIFLIYRETRPYGGNSNQLVRRALLKWSYRFDALL